MKFEIYNNKNERVFITSSIECLPQKEYLDSMIKNGYKFKLDDKTLTKKQIIELYKIGDKNEYKNKISQ